MYVLEHNFTLLFNRSIMFIEVLLVTTYIGCLITQNFTITLLYLVLQMVT